MGQTLRLVAAAIGMVPSRAWSAPPDMSLHAPSPPERRPARPLARLAARVLLAAFCAASAARAAEPDYSGWKDLLQRHLKVLHEKGKPWDSRFDYEQLFIDEDIWHKHRADGLATLHTQLIAVTPSDLSPAERTAWAINAYNFLVIERMTLHLLVPGRKFMRHDSPRQVHTDEGSFFAAVVTNVEGRAYSLAGFERRFVYGDTSADPTADGMMAREKPGDPRLMFALCKAALCSGPLLPWVYRADSLDAQLDRATRLALSLPQYVRADAATGELAATNRFFEERSDFGGAQLPDVVPFLRRRGAPGTRQLIAARKLTRVSRYFEPDWKLNQYDHPAPKLPTDTGAAPATPSRRPR